MIISKEVAANCAPLVQHNEAINALVFFLEDQVKQINTQLHRAVTWEEVLRLQGKYQAIKELTTIRQDVLAVMGKKEFK